MPVSPTLLHFSILILKHKNSAFNVTDVKYIAHI